MRVLNLISGLALAVLAAGCAAPASQYYTLLPGASSAAGTAQSPYAAPGKFAISVQPVDLPQQVDRPQIVLSQPGSAQVQVLNGSLWAAPLADEIRNSLADDLSRQLGVLELPVRAAPASLPLWVVNLAVQRFDSVYNQQVILEATWRLESRNPAGKSARVCRAAVRVPVQPGMPALVAGHQEALHRLATIIAAQLSNRPVSGLKAEGIDLKGCT